MSEGYVEGEFAVGSALGLHARPAGRLASLASKFDAIIEISTQTEWVDVRNVLSLLALAAGPGTMLKVRASGIDAESALSAVGELLSKIESEARHSAEPSI